MLFLRNHRLERNPHNQKQSNLYKKVLASLKKHGQINPLVCIQEGERYKVCVGNNRYLAGLELGFKEFDIIVSLTENSQHLMHLTKSLYKKTDVTQS